MLTGEQIIRLLGKKIIIHPYEPNHLRGATYNLTVSEFVWLHPKTQKARQEGNILPLSGRKEGSGVYYEIPENGLVTILTREVLYVDNSIAGQFHSKVDMATKGFSHVSTTLDPDWKGPLLITMKNQAKFPQKLWHGETFIKVAFHKLPKPTQYRHNNDPGRGKLLMQQGFAFPKEHQDFLDSPENSNIESIKKAFEDSDVWKTITANQLRKYNKSVRWLIFALSALAFLISATAYIWIPNFFKITLSGTDLTGILAVVLPSFYVLVESFKNPPWQD